MKRARISAVPLLLAFALTVGVAGEFVSIQTRMVPVARLVENLQRDLKANPKSVEVRINLARLHGMAYALKSDEVPALRWHSNRDEPYYASQNRIPYNPRDAPTVERQVAAREHLLKAVAHYEAALALEPGNRLARLGYGWSLDQAGEKARAIAEYRTLISEAWVEESKLSIVGLQRFFTDEAAGYLILLLDPVRDADEIADLHAKQQLIENKARAITPLAIPLADNLSLQGIIAPDGPVAFDADGSGLPRRWTWIQPNAGWLVHDPERKGQITSALQWFGNVTFWLFWTNGYEALGALDDDDSGALTGDELRDLAIWHDRNTNGISERGEVRPLSDHGIVGLSCRYVEGDGITLAAFSQEGVQLTNGRTRTSYDVMLSRVDVRTFTRR